MLIPTAKKTRLSLPNKTSLGIYTGYGSTAGFARNNTETVIDFEGVSRTAKVNEAAFKGARRVENLVSGSSENILNAGWVTVGTGVTKTATGVIFNGNSADGLNNLGAIPGGSANKTMIVSVTVSVAGGSANFRIRCTHSAVLDYLSGELTATTTPQRFSFKQTFTGSSGNGFINGGIVNSLSSPNSATFITEKWSFEDVTGQANQNPSEYVSSGVLTTPYHGANVDGVKYFNYLNGNTVLNNVVTETKGAAISEATLKGVKIKTGAVQTIKTAQNINKYQGSLSFEFTPDANAVGTVALGGSKQDDNNYVEIIQTAGTGYIFRKCISGVIYDALLSGDFVADTTYTVKIKWSSYSGTEIFVNGVKGVNNPNTAPLPLGSVWYVGADRNGANQAGACFKNVLTKHK